MARQNLEWAAPHVCPQSGSSRKMRCRAAFAQLGQGRTTATGSPICCESDLQPSWPRARSSVAARDPASAPAPARARDGRRARKPGLANCNEVSATLLLARQQGCLRLRHFDSQKPVVLQVRLRRSLQVGVRPPSRVTRQPREGRQLGVPALALQNLWLPMTSASAIAAREQARSVILQQPVPPSWLEQDGAQSCWVSVRCPASHAPNSSSSKTGLSKVLDIPKGTRAAEDVLDVPLASLEPQRTGFSHASPGGTSRSCCCLWLWAALN